MAVIQTRRHVRLNVYYMHANERASGRPDLSHEYLWSIRGSGGKYRVTLAKVGGVI